MFITRGSSATHRRRPRLPFIVVPTSTMFPSSRASKQAWVQAHLWDKRTRQRSQTVNVLVDSGAGGGNDGSSAFIQGVERRPYGGNNIMSKQGRGRLRAANPSDSDVPPMTILGTACFFLVFPSIDETFGVSVRVVEGLPVGLILGMVLHASIPEHTRLWRYGTRMVSTVAHVVQNTIAAMTGASERESKSQNGQDMEPEVKDTSRQMFYTAEWRPEEDEVGNSQPSEVLAIEALDLGSTAWEDE